jgi:hypothetical protein
MWNSDPDFILTADERELTRIQKPITKPVFGFYVRGQGFYPRQFAFIRG